MISTQTIDGLRTWAAAHERHGYVQALQVLEVLDAYRDLEQSCTWLEDEVKRLKLLITPPQFPYRPGFPPGGLS